MAAEKKTLDSSWTTLLLRSGRINLSSKCRVSDVKKIQSSLFGIKALFANNFWTKKSKGTGRHRVSFVETRRNPRTLTLKGQCQNIPSGQCHVRSHRDPSRSRISVDASRRGTHNGAMPNDLSLFNNKLEARNALYLIWPRVTRRRGHWVKPSYVPSRVA